LNKEFLMSGAMGGMDIRVPMGLMFAIIGAVIAVYGMITNGQPMYETHSLGVNINLWWGLFMFLFGAVMLLLAYVARDKGGDGSRIVNPH
jgi:hypothetical protein